MTNAQLQLYLESIGVVVGDTAGNELHYCCPLHDDKVISASFNSDKETWKCFAQCGGGGLIDFIMRAEKKVKSVAIAKAKLITEALPTIPAEEVEESYQALLSNPEAMEFLTGKRKIAESIIKHFKLGYKGKRIWIPQSLDGLYYQVKRWDAMRKCDGEAKFRAYKSGYGKGLDLLWPMESLKFDHVFLCEGEGDAMAALSLGLPACTLGSATSSVEDVLDQLQGKMVLLTYDNDEAGRKGAAYNAEILAQAGIKTKIIDMRKLGCVKDKEDVTDAISKYGMQQNNFYDLVEVTPDYTSEVVTATKPKSLNFEPVPFKDLLHPSCNGKRVRVETAVFLWSGTPSMVVKTATVPCAASKDAKCHACPFSKMGMVSIDALDKPEEFLMLTQSTIAQEKMAVQKLFGVDCRKCQVNTQELQAVRIMELLPPLGTQDKKKPEIVVIGFLIDKTELVGVPGRYMVQGLVTREPQHGQVAMIITDVEELRVSKEELHDRFVVH